MDALTGSARAGAERSSLGEGRVLGRYTLLERLGSGGFGEVWRARDELLHREVAVKRIAGGDLAPRAAREAQAAARLSHPAIVALYEADSEDGAFYLTSELVHGATLAQLNAEEALEDEEIVQIGIALCGALQHAHERGVIHRDVKPQNILVPDEPVGEGVAKLTDFGGARLDGEDALTRTGDVLGTLAYMAPEQLDGGLAGPEADLYALALVLYEALSGENPVRAGTAAATVRRIGEPLPPLRRLRPDLPRRLTAALDAALHPDPGRRGELADLAEALAGGAHRATRTLRSGWRAPAAEETALLEGSRQETTVAPAGAGRRSAGPGRIAEPEPVAARSAAPAGAMPARGAYAPRIALPKLVWALAAVAAVVWALAAGKPGLALLVAAALLPLLVAMPRRAGLTWLAAALSPLLAVAGLAAAFPALAARARRGRQRLALGALGFWWLCLAGAALARAVPPAPAPAASSAAPGPLAAWQGSLSAAEHALAPLLTLSTLAGVMLWALGALLLPSLLRGRSLAVDLLLAGAWSATMLLAPGVVAQALQRGAPVLSGGSGGAALAVLAAALGALVAAGGRIVRSPRGPDALKVEL